MLPVLPTNKDGYIEIHVNRLYPENTIRHWTLYGLFHSSTSGQYDSVNFPTLVNKIEAEIAATEQKFGKIVFINTRQDTHFELNQVPVSLKRIDPKDDNNGKSGEEVIKHERETASRYLGKKVEFLTRDELEAKQEKTVEPKQTPSTKVERVIEKRQTIGHCALVRDFVEDPKWKERHTFIRFAIQEHGPLTAAQTDAFLDFLKVIQTQQAWLHVNSIVGGGPASLLILLKGIHQMAATTQLEAIIAIHDNSKKLMEEPKADDKNRQAKIDRQAFIREFYTFIKTREPNQKWSEWKKS